MFYLCNHGGGGGGWVGGGCMKTSNILTVHVVLLDMQAIHESFPH